MGRRRATQEQTIRQGDVMKSPSFGLRHQSLARRVQGQEQPRKLWQSFNRWLLGNEQADEHLPRFALPEEDANGGDGVCDNLNNAYHAQARSTGEDAARDHKFH
jgi:hypothetical protein